MASVEVKVEGESIGAITPPFTIGRDPDCDVIVPDSSVSRRHVKVSISDTGLFVEDVGSSNGTWIDGRRISREIVAFNHPVIVGRVSVVMSTTDEAGKAPKAIQNPPVKDKVEQRKETLAVDIPQGYFDPSKNAPAMRMFECPGCNRRLRCASTTRRVKCRTCEAIIRFDGEVPKLETEGVNQEHVDPRDRRTLPKHQASQAGANSPEAPGAPANQSNAAGNNYHPSPVTQLPPEPRIGYWVFLTTTQDGHFTLFAEALGTLLFFVGIVAGEHSGFQMMLFGATIHISALVWGSIQWLARGGGPTAHEKLQMIDKWLSEGVINADEHRRIRNAILTKR